MKPRLAKLEILITAENDDRALGALFHSTDFTPTDVIRETLQWLEENEPDAFWDAITPYR